MGASHAERGRITDEHIDMFISLCTQDVAEYEGNHARISGMTFFPKPVQRPHPPIWIGGNSRAALQRTARLGNGWHGIRISPEELVLKRKHLSLLCEKYERSIDSIEISLRMTTQIGEPQRSSDGERVPLTGATQQIIDDLRRYEEAGLEYVVLSIEARDTQSTIDSVRRFAAEIAPKI